MASSVRTLWTCTLIAFVVTHLTHGNAQQFCSFFGNKSPSPQPGLQNCTWYRDSSCCVNEEITSLFAKVQVPANSNGVCRNYINYLMCYVCDPKQNFYYRQERLTVCASFCNDVLNACKDAILKGTRLRDRYGTNGTAYCVDSRFEVFSGSSTEQCFTLEESKRTLVASASSAKPNSLAVLFFTLAVLGFTSRHTKSSLGVAVGVALLLATMSGSSHALVSDQNIKDMATQLENALVGIGRDGIGRQKVQELYDNASSTTEDLNITGILGVIEDRLMSITDDLNTAAGQLKTALINARRVASANPTASPRLSDLPSAVFTDADSREAIERLDLTYNSTFRNYVSFRQSSVKIPDDVDRSALPVYESISWSAAIDSTLQTLQTARNVRWAYFGAESGIYRSFPAAAWVSNFAGFRVDYDARLRPWYLSATSGPKAVGILLDCSASMAENSRWSIAKAAITQIINSLSRDDQVNIVCSRGWLINPGGVRRNYSPSVVGCQKTGFIRATPSNRAQLLEKLNEQSTYGSGESHYEALTKLIGLFPGGTGAAGGCEKVLILVTDGTNTDPDAFSQVCYDKNRGSYGCNELVSDFSSLYTYVTQIHNGKGIKVIGIETGDKGSQLPGKLGCDNDGVFIQLTSSTNIRSQLTPYYSYLARLANTDNEVIKPTAPYVDASGLGRIITVSRAVYDPNNAQSLLGVIGVDAVLDDLENALLDDQFGLSYAFLIDTEGRAIVHPRLRPSAELVDDPVYPPIAELEVHNNLPIQFADVLTNMKAQKTGSSGRIIGPRPQQRGGLSDGVVWFNNIEFTYHYSAIAGTQYSFAFVVTTEDIRQAMLAARTYSPGQARNYYHEISKYNTNTRNSIGYMTSVRGYNNLAISTRQSTFKLAAQAFCDPTRYLLSDVPNFTTVDSFFNNNATQRECDNGGTFVPQVRATVWTTQAIQGIWDSRPQSVKDRLVWSYYGSANGMWRSFPGSRSTRDYDPTRRPWYRRALANPAYLYASSAVYLDAGGIGKVVTLAQTVFQAKSQAFNYPNNTLCSSPPYAGDCKCLGDGHCKSKYCYNSRCSNTQVAGVAAVDIRFEQFAALTETTLLNTMGIGTTDLCSQSNTRCLLINDAAEVVYDESFKTVADGDPRNYQNVPLGYLFGKVMLELLDMNVFTRFGFLNQQGLCSIAPYAPRSSDRDHILTAEQQDNYYENKGPIPNFQNNYGCPLDQVQYQRNPTYDLTGTSVQQSFRGPCRDGQFRMSSVNNTNLLLLIIETSQDKTDRLFNFNCHIYNNVARSGGFEAKETSCGIGFTDTEITGTCPRKVVYTPSCMYNSAPLLVQPSVMVALCTTLLSFFLTKH